MTGGGAASTDPVARFAEAAERYCAWAENEPEVPEWELETAIRFLLELTACALDLPEVEVEDGDEDGERPSHDAWQSVFRRFTPVPASYYATCDPEELVDGSPVVGDVHDDLADTWRDLRHGLDLHRAGRVDAACWHWRFSFRSHWGWHATEALRVLVAKLHSS